ncbi:MAG: hypothetical protein HY323_07295 [Betaproteobacteria bacterium]|nr:hypothetical protein [Betaproteobacteria bacterium]
MAVTTYRNVRVTFNAVSWLSYHPEVTLVRGFPEIDITPMGSTGKKMIGGGVEAWEVRCRLFLDVADNAIDEQLSGLLADAQAGTSRTMALILDKDAAISAANPEYQGSGMIFDYTAPFKVGDVAVIDVTIKGSDGIAIIRDITP